MDVLRLHLEYDMEDVDENELMVLKKYAGVKQSISRDILVPADITLHALNYVILRAFGWQNGHLHNFSLPEEVFKELTDNLFLTWSKLAGVYFRFPTEDFDDIYWDDDYQEGESFKSWMRKKYTGPYKYKGFSEHYLMSQIEVQEMFARWDEITVREFKWRAEKKPAPYNVKLKEATIDQVMHAFSDVVCYELLERLPLVEVLGIKDSTYKNITRVKEDLLSQLDKINVSDMIQEHVNKSFRSMGEEQEILNAYNRPVLPVTDKLLYNYDYGDNWKVLITCDNVYKQEDVGLWKSVNGYVDGVSVEDLETVISKHCPICIEKDGIELVDDVGGIRGFCEMLQTIYEVDVDNVEAIDERDNTLVWANSMGWTGRKTSPKRTL